MMRIVFFVLSVYFYQIAEAYTLPNDSFESADVTDLSPYIDKNTLVVLDIDNTLMRSKTSLGSGQWYYHALTEEIAKGVSAQQSHLRIHAIWDRLVPHVQVEPTNSKTPDWLRSLKTEGISVIGLTSRSYEIAVPTLRQLKKADLHFTELAELKWSFSLADPVRVHDGVVFANDFNDKSQVFAEFLEQLIPHHSPITRVVFADDLPKNIINMQKVVREAGLEFIGLRCSSEDARIARLDPLVVKKQWQLFEEILSNEEAEVILGTEEGKKLLALYRDPVTEPSRIDFSASTTFSGKVSVGRNTLHQTDNTLGILPSSPSVQNDSESTVIETDQVTDLLKFITSHSLVVFDLNDTLMSTAQTLGSNQWADRLVRQQLKGSFSKEMVLDRLVPFWHKVLLRTRVVAVDPEISHLIYHLQQMGIQTIGLTARYPEMAYCTLQQLQHLYIDFTQSEVAAVDFTLAMLYPAKFLGGVIFAGLQNDKGTALLRFLKQRGITFDRLIFVDDKLKNVKQVQAAARQLCKPCIGVWYRAVEKKQLQVDEKIAQVQAVVLETIISDELAMDLIRHDLKKDK